MATEKEMTDKEYAELVKIKFDQLKAKYKNNLQGLYNSMKALQVPGKSATISSLVNMQERNNALGEISQMNVNYNSQLLSLTRKLTEATANKSTRDMLKATQKVSEKPKTQIQSPTATADELKAISQAIDQLAREFTAASASVAKNGWFGRNASNQRNAPEQQQTVRQKGPGRRGSES